MLNVNYHANIVTRNEQTARQIHLYRGVYPFHYPEPRGIEEPQWQTDVRSRKACSLFST